MTTSFKSLLLATCLCAAPVTLMAQTNSGQAPILPPPPASALQPIDPPTAAATVPVAKTTTTTTSSSKKTTAAVVPPFPPTAQAMGTGNTSATSASATPAATTTSATTTTQTTTNVAPVPVVAAQNAGQSNAQINNTGATGMGNAGAPIALPGMPITEAGLSNANAAATTLNPGLVGAGANAGYDQAAYEEQLKQRLADIKVETRERALQRATESTFPMKPEEIEDVIRQLRKTQAAVQNPIEQPPATPRAVVHTMELDPGAQPPTIQLLNGNVTSLSILDATGQPWPIVDIAFGGAFDVKPPEAGGHIIRISPLKEYAHGNMSVRLQKLATPLTFSLQAGGKEVHYRFDARVPQLGPNAKSSLIDRGLNITAGDDTSLSAILVGTPPPSAEKLKVSGVDGRTTAYRMNGQTYVRTPYTLLSPTWASSVSSADGTTVYQMSDAPVVLLSDNGIMVRAQIQQPVIDPFGLPDDQKALPSGLTPSSGDRG